MDIVEGLNPAQAQAVQAVDGPVLVLAGPGSGKTRVLTHRIAYLIRARGVRPYHILAVTFTNKAAREMVSRLTQLIGSDVSRLTIGTFHATCARILRREARHVGLDSSFVIYDQDDQRRLVASILKDLELDTAMYRPASVLNAISRAKNDLITAQTYSPPTYWHEAVARVFEQYEKEKAKNNALDFDDLLLKAEELFRVCEEVRDRYRNRYSYMLVDEFQDTNKAQYELILRLASQRRNIFVVGDEDQSIYSWRGADFRNVLRFREDFPQARVFLLEQNYRSTRTILEAAQAIISHNSQREDKKLWTENEDGCAISLIEAYDQREEAQFVVGEMEHLVSQRLCRYGDCAVMYRTNAQSRVLEDACVRHGIPYTLIGATRFYLRREIKDVLSYLRVIYNPHDEVSLLRIINVPARGIGGKTIEQLRSWAGSMGLSMGSALQRMVELSREKGAESEMPFSPRSRSVLLAFAQRLAHLVEARAQLTLSGLLDAVLERTGYLSFLRDGTEEGEERANNVRELFSVTEVLDHLPPELALPTFLEETALVSDTDNLKDEADTATLLTLHMAKGLEYDTVFIVGMEEGICPHSRSMDQPDEMEEERRLCYVGVTRAERRLYLLRTFRRTIYGDSDVREPSRFLGDIPTHLTEGNAVPQRLPARAATTAGNTVRREVRELMSGRRAVVQRARARRRLLENAASATIEAEGPQRAAVPFAPADPGQPAARPSFHPGQSVRHPVFGPGMVVASKVVGDDEEVTVAFEGQGVKRLMASYAKMEEV
ncbi:MAG TPA: UvrD-helicase domain-containing protein [Anaerolineae bacterium]|nr:UvrD-helicase domain-containing protein [Anaerolineae bacterium]